MRIIRAAGQDLRVRLEPLDDHDEWVAAYESSLSPDQVAAWREREKELLAQWRRERTLLEP